MSTDGPARQVGGPRGLGRVARRVRVVIDHGQVVEADMPLGVVLEVVDFHSPDANDPPVRMEWFPDGRRLAVEP